MALRTTTTPTSVGMTAGNVIIVVSAWRVWILVLRSVEDLIMILLSMSSNGAIVTALVAPKAPT